MIIEFEDDSEDIFYRVHPLAPHAGLATYAEKNSCTAFIHTDVSPSHTSVNGEMI